MTFPLVGRKPAPTPGESDSVEGFVAEDSSSAGDLSQFCTEGAIRECVGGKGVDEVVSAAKGAGAV